jgi:uncharacterized protein involved in outer membrane biogenesis
MSRTLRNILIAVGILVVILIVVPFLIPVNRFRPTIEEKASASLGRKVQIGDLSLSLLGGALTAKTSPSVTIRNSAHRHSLPRSRSAWAWK